MGRVFSRPQGRNWRDKERKTRCSRLLQSGWKEKEVRNAPRPVFYLARCGALWRVDANLSAGEKQRAKKRRLGIELELI